MLARRGPYSLLLLLIVLAGGLLYWGHVAAGAAGEPDRNEQAAAVGYGSQIWQSQIVDMPGLYDHMSDRSLRFDSADHAHMVFGGDRLYYAHHDGAEWHVEVVDNDVGTGTGASLDLDAAGRPHISYLDLANNRLKYAHWDGANWHIQVLDKAYPYSERTSIALDGAERPHIAYKQQDWQPPSYCPGTGYAHWDGGQWQLERFAECGGFVSMALDSSGVPHITFNDDGRIQHATKVAGAWQIGDVSSADAGYGSSVAVDSAGRPHVVYIDASTDSQLVYSRWDGSQWLPQTVQQAEAGLYLSLILDNADEPHIAHGSQYITPGSEGLAQPNSVNVMPGSFSSIALDSNGYPAITYYNDFVYSVGCKRWNGVEWVSEVVTYGGFAGQANSLDLDGQGQPHLSYYLSGSSNGGAIRYAHRSGEVWSSETISGTYMPMYAPSEYDTSLAVDSNNRPHIAFWYSELYDDGLYYAFKGGEDWHAELVADDADSENDLVLDGTDTPHIAFIDSGALKYGYRNDGEWLITDVDDQGAGRLAALALDGAGAPRILYVDNTDTGKRLILATRTGAAWSFEEVAAVGWGTGIEANLILDAAGKAHVAYVLANEDDSVLKYAAQVGTGWTQEIVDSRQWSMTWPSIFLGADGQPMIVYNYQGLQIATKAGGLWSVQKAFSMYGDYLSVAFSPRGLYAGYYDRRGGGLIMASPLKLPAAGYLPLLTFR